MNYTILDLLNRQKKLQLEYQKLNPNVSFEKSDNKIDDNKVKDGILLMVKECMEVLDEINYKTHVLKKKEIDLDKILIEMIDVLKFWLNITIYLGFDEQSISEAFDRKSIINYEKVQEQLKIRESEEKAEARWETQI